MNDLWTEQLELTNLPEVHKELLHQSRSAIIDEIQPSRTQLEHGLSLHYESFAGDAMGSVPACTHSIAAERLTGELSALLKKLERQSLEKADILQAINSFIFRREQTQAAFDPQYHSWRSDLFSLAGINLGVESVTDPIHNEFQDALRRVAVVNLAYDLHRSVAPLRSACQLKQSQKGGIPRVVQHMAGVGAFAEADDPMDKLDLFFALGIRMAQLTYIQNNRLCASWLQGEDDKGLTELGRQTVARMNELGIAVDIAHCGLRSSFDILESSTEPVILSHTACCELYDDSRDTSYIDAVFEQSYARGVDRPQTPPAARNVSDDLLRGIKKQGGLACIFNLESMLHPGEEGMSFGCFARHIEHAVQIAGIDHIGIGTDRSYFPWMQKSQPNEWTNWPYYTVGLVCRGFSDEEIRKLIGDNLLKHLIRVIDKHPWTDFLPSAEAYDRISQQGYMLAKMKNPSDQE